MRGQYGQLQTVIFTILGLFCASTLPFCVNSSAIAQTPIATTCTPREINKYIKKLETSEPIAFDALVACEFKAVPALVKELDNNDEKTRILIISALGAIGKPAKPASEHLSQLLTQEKRRTVRVATVYALTEIGKEGIPSVVSALQHSDWYIRSAAADALGEIGAIEAIPALNEALEDKDWYVSSRVMRAIDKISITKVHPLPPTAAYKVGEITLSHFKKPPLMCRIALISAVFRWKCPSIRWQDAYTKK